MPASSREISRGESPANTLCSGAVLSKAGLLGPVDEARGEGRLDPRGGAARIGHLGPHIRLGALERVARRERLVSREDSAVLADELRRVLEVALLRDAHFERGR